MRRNFEGYKVQKASQCVLCVG